MAISAWFGNMGRTTRHVDSVVRRTLIPATSVGRELLCLSVAVAMIYVIVDRSGIASGLFRFVADHPNYDIDDLLIGVLAAGGGALTFSLRRWRDLKREIGARRSAEDKAQRLAALLQDALDSMPEGIVIYDAEERLVLYNDTYRCLYPHGAACMQPGLKFEDILRRRMTSNEFLDAIGQEATWFADRVRQFREAKGEHERRLPDGKWTLVTERRMRDGGTAGLRIDITALKQAQLALCESEARLDRAQEIAGIGSWELDIPGNRYTWSKQMYRLRGLSPEASDPIGPPVGHHVHPDDEAMVRQYREDLKAGIRRDPIEGRFIHPNGEIRTLRVEGCPIADADGAIFRLVGTLQDVTEQRQVQRQLAQAQKMEAIGKLAGGMAHDVNNVLGIVIGNLELMEDDLADNLPCEELRNEALTGALHGAELTRRLLAFARRQPLSPRLTDVNELVGDISKLLNRALGEQIELNLRLAPNLWPVVIDPVQLEAALTNLATNARDAMPRGGRLGLTTSNAHVGGHRIAEHPDEVAPGDYVLIEVLDTGVGIPSEIIGNIFEPFFTTKERSKASGLGLSMIFGFMQQSGGHVSASSKLGEGSIFRLYLPRSPDSPTNPSHEANASGMHRSAGGGETVLVVDDNAQMRRITARRLISLGYRVHEAENGASAAKMLAMDTAVDLLFTDVVMPGSVDGVDLVRWATAIRPGLRCLLTSGFSDPGGSNQRVKALGHPLLSKPYRQEDLADTVRKVLDQTPAAAG
jgi:PAS domain S-box-containing protein